MTEVLSGTVQEYLDRLGSGSAVPGGGSAAALAAAMGAALLAMAARISARKAADDASGARLLELLPELDQLGAELGHLSQADIDSYRAVIDARKRGAEPDEMKRAFAGAAEIPLQTAKAAHRCLQLLPEVSSRLFEPTRSDLDAGRGLLELGKRVALANVAVNLPELGVESRVRIERDYAQLAELEPQ